MKKFLGYIVRVSLLLLMIGLGFIAVFPDVFKLKDIMLSEYKENKQKAALLEKVQQQEGIKQREEREEQQEAIEACPITPVTHVARAPNTAKDSENSDAETPKILINRDPIVFDNVCSGDTLKYNIYGENLDHMMVTYENESDDDNVSLEMSSELKFQNQMIFKVPQEWYGETRIIADGFTARGKVRLSQSQVTFNVKQRKVAQELKP